MCGLIIGDTTGLTNFVTINSDTILGREFESNSSSQNHLVRWALSLLIYYKLVLSLIDVRYPTHSTHVEAYTYQT